MHKFREAIDEASEEFRKVTSFYAKQRIFGIEGEKYKKIFDETKPLETFYHYLLKLNGHELV
jgi:hypothetical protein